MITRDMTAEDGSLAIVTMGGHYGASGAWDASGAYATSIIIDARGPNPAVLRGVAWRCLRTLCDEYNGMTATPSLVSSQGVAVDLRVALEDIREKRPVKTLGEELIVSDLVPGALVTGARHEDEARFDADLESGVAATQADWRARAIAHFECNYLGPADVIRARAPPLLWLLMPSTAAMADGSWRQHATWTAETFELAALTEPVDDELSWAVTTLRLPFNAASDQLLHAAPYLLRMLRVAARVGVGGLSFGDIDASDALKQLAVDVKAKVDVMAEEPAARRQRVGEPGSSDALPVRMAGDWPFDWRSLGDQARADPTMTIVPDPRRVRAVWSAMEHLPPAVRLLLEEKAALQAELRSRDQEDTVAAAPPTWQLADPSDPEIVQLTTMLLDSEPTATDIVIWKVQHAQAERRFKAESTRIGNERLLWHSPGIADPLTLVRSDFPFDFTRSNAAGGSYGKGIYFSEHAMYGGRILPCRVSELDDADGLSTQSPAVGDDVMLGDGLETYNVLRVELDGTCQLRRLRWDAHHKEQTHQDEIHRLGNGEDDTVLWRYADRRYAILTAVALGNVNLFGAEFREDLQRAPDGFHSVSGTEGDLAISQVLSRSDWYQEWRVDMAPLRQRGAEYGLQHVVYHEVQTCPRFIVRYRRKRVGPAPPERSSSSRGRGSGRGRGRAGQR